jgi:ATP-dependent Lhr-like helicase
MCGGFSATYAIFKAMEESGKVRRGYFVAGRGATQFALPGADDRLRALREPGEPMTTRVLAATDPANPYGAALPWPKAEEPAGQDDAARAPRPQRAAGALVVLCDGALAGWLGKSGQALLAFLPPDEPLRARVASALAEALAALVVRGPRRVLLLRSSSPDADPGGSLAMALARAGFTHGDKGWLRTRPASSTATPGGLAPARLGPGQRSVGRG